MVGDGRWWTAESSDEVERGLKWRFELGMNSPGREND
jgi:hypothetical protein